MEQLSKLYYDWNFAFDKIKSKTSNNIGDILWEKEESFYYEWSFLWLIKYNYDKNNNILEIWYINSMNDKLVGIIDHLKKQNTCNNPFIENEYKKYLSIYKKTKGLWTYMIEKLIEKYNPRKLIIDTPLMKSRKFWFKIVRKLYKEWKFKNVKFVRNGFRKEYNSMPDIIKNNSEISHAFSKIIFEK